MKYQIPINVGSKPNFYQNVRYGRKMFDDKNIKSILLLGPFPIDNYDSVYEIYDYLQKYFYQDLELTYPLLILLSIPIFLLLFVNKNLCLAFILY